MPEFACRNIYTRSWRHSFNNGLPVLMPCTRQWKIFLTWIYLIQNFRHHLQPKNGILYIWCLSLTYHIIIQSPLPLWQLHLPLYTYTTTYTTQHPPLPNTHHPYNQYKLKDSLANRPNTFTTNGRNTFGTLATSPE